MQDTEEMLPGKPVVPQFGLIDLVDAFTAFRHEYRTQAKESRVTAELLTNVSRQLEQITLALQAPATPSAQSTQPLQADIEQTQMLGVLIQLDIQWTRALEVVQRSEPMIAQQAQASAELFEATVSALSPLRRWLAGPLISSYRRSQAAMPKFAGTAAMMEGLNMVLAKLRQVLQDFGIQRVDTQGQPFDGQLMRSISSVADASVPSGHVAQQLSSAYLRHGQVVKYAEVRVAI